MQLNITKRFDCLLEKPILSFDYFVAFGTGKGHMPLRRILLVKAVFLWKFAFWLVVSRNCM